MDAVFIWLLIASLAGFVIAALFAGLLKLKRNLYLLVYVPIHGPFGSLALPLVCNEG